MTITYRGGGSEERHAAVTVTVTSSVSPNSGDLLIACSALDSPTLLRAWPTDFTEFGHVTVSLDGGQLNWAYKISNGTEGTSYVMGSGSTSSNQVDAILVFGNVNTATAATPAVCDVAPTSNTITATDNDGSWDVIALGVPSGAANRMLVYIGGVDNATSGTVTSAPPSASPDTWTERVDLSSTNFTNIAVYTCIDAAGTYTSDVDAVQTGSGNAYKMAFLIPLRDLGGGSSIPVLMNQYRQRRE